MIKNIKKSGKKIIMPRIGLLTCNSGASNTGSLTGIAAIEIIKEFDDVGILSLPSLANNVSRQVMVTKDIQYIVVVDGCKNSCAKKVLEKLGLEYDAYLNIEKDIGIRKIGPFSTLEYSQEEVEKVKNEINKLIEEVGKNEKTQS